MGDFQRRFLRNFLTTAALIALPAAAIAASPAVAHQFNIAPKPLQQALRDYSHQAGVQVLFAQSDVNQLRSRALIGRFSADEALSHLLRASGLEAIAASPGVLVIRRAPARAILTALSQSSPTLSGEPSQVTPVVELPAGPTSAETRDIIVTGSLIRQSRTASPMTVVDASALSIRAVSNPAELVRAVTANAGSEAQVDQLNQPLTSGTAQFNLRNLGLGSTLVLVNGRRQTLSAVASGDGSTFTDINSLTPLIAIQRVDVVKDGAAATYGSDAVAGVVNFITRQRVERPEVSGRMNFIDGARQTDLEAIAGARIAGGDLVVAASYYESTRLSTDERSFSRARTFDRPSWHSVSSYGQPGSYFLPSQGRFQPDPDCLNPAFPDSFKNSPTDTFCRFDFSEFFDLIPEERRVVTFATYNTSLGGGIDLNLEAGYANTYSKVLSSPSFPLVSISPIVPASHPDNPFGEDGLFRGRLLGSAAGASIATFNYDTFRLAAGLTGPISGSWTWRMNGTYSQQSVIYNKPDVLRTPLNNALRGLGGAGCDPATGTPGSGNCVYFNPFGSSALGTGTANSPALINSLLGFTGLHGRTSLVTADGLVTGDLLTYSGGTIAAAVGAQYRRSTFRHDWSDAVNAGELINLGQAPDFSGDQENASVFGELKVPFGERVEAQISGRYEKYFGSFGNFSPKITLLARPIDAISLRASYGKAFRAPSVYQLIAVQSAQPSVNDGGTFIFTNTQTFGKPDLKPEKSTNYNIGATVRPFRGLELSGDFFSFDYKDLIVKENPQPIIDQARADTLAGLTDTPAQRRLTRDTTGALQVVRLNFINASSVKTQGIDVSARYTLETGIGTFEANGAWTHIRRYTIRLAAGGAVVDGAGSVNFNNLGRSLPRDRVEYGLRYTTGRHQLNALGHFVSSYTNDRSGITERRIKAWNTFDLQYVLTLDRLIGSSETQLTVGAINVADRNPPVAQLNLGFDPIVADPRGRVLYVALKQGF